MLIRLTQEQEARLLEWAGVLTGQEFDADIEPSGYELRFGIAPGVGWFAEAVKGGDVLDLGEAEVVLGRDISR